MFCHLRRRNCETVAVGFQQWHNSVQYAAVEGIHRWHLLGGVRSCLFTLHTIRTGKVGEGGDVRWGGKAILLLHVCLLVGLGVVIQ